MNLENALQRKIFMIWHLWDLVLHALTQYFILLIYWSMSLNRKVKILVIDKAEEFCEYRMGTVQGLIH
jgi:hypothetical protein